MRDECVRINKAGLLRKELDGRLGDQLLDELALGRVRPADVGREDRQVIRELVEQLVQVPAAHVTVIGAKLAGATSLVGKVNSMNAGPVIEP